MAALCLSWH